MLRKHRRPHEGGSIPGDRKKSRPSHRAVALHQARFEVLEDRTLLTIAPAGSSLALSNLDQTVWFQELSQALQEKFLSEGAYVDFTYSDGAIKASLSLSGVECQQVSLDGEDYLQLLVPNWGSYGEEGQAELPVLRTTITVPEGMEVVVQYTIGSTRTLITTQDVAPMQPAIPEVEGGEDLVAFTYDTTYYESDGSDDDEPVWVSGVQIAGSSRTVDIEFRPFVYHPDTGEIEVTTDLSCVFCLVADTIGDASTADTAAESTTTVASADVVSAAADADYLIITADEFYDAVLPLAQWKHKMGYRTYVATMSEVGTTDDDIYNFIKAVYDADNIKPQYVLLVGDHENVPSYEIIGHPYYGSTHVWYTDYTYGCVAGSDNYADLALGRLPGDTAAQITTMVNRILNLRGVSRHGQLVRRRAPGRLFSGFGRPRGRPLVHGGHPMGGGLPRRRL